MSSGHDHRHPQPATACLARSVVDALAEDPTLEAVTVDQANQKISVATLGRTDVDEITRRLSGKIQAAQSASATRFCNLLNGKAECSTCANPLSPDEQRGINIKLNDSAVTISRVTCPTAPSFWRWRELSFPKIVQRDVEFLEHA